ncbi:MAG: galactose oxidase-like domain-containing protein [Gammaproteobacteria bacterium]
MKVTPPANSNIAPPGHYMLWVVDSLGVPSQARIIRIT